MTAIVYRMTMSPCQVRVPPTPDALGRRPVTSEHTQSQSGPKQAFTPLLGFEDARAR